MKTALKLILVYFIITQLAAPLLMMIPCVLYLFATGGLTQAALTDSLLVPTLLAGQTMMGIYLWKAGYISTQKSTWSAVSVPYLFFSALAMLSGGFIVSSFMSLMDWLPNILEQTFETLLSSWSGIFSIVIAGPVIEEVLFRGAITQALLKQYSPVKAILFSALLFGLIHINPAQVVPAFLIGILLAWTYYKTGSLIPCIVMHILNNSLSVYISMKYPEAKEIDDLISGTPYFIVLAGMILAFVLSIASMRHFTKNNTGLG